MKTQEPASDHVVDVLIVGAGLSGIGLACYLKQASPEKSFLMLEMRGATGGTWDLFRYPGVRSDSDLYTFAYAFKPWTDDAAIASADAILSYIREAAQEYGVNSHIQYHQKVVKADWCSSSARWSVLVEGTDTGARHTITCKWFFSAAGYYRYDQGYSPKFEGSEQFKGTIVHPQHWPKRLDYKGKRVVVIGSGATAVTLVPAMTDLARHVTMLQRTPTYVVGLPSKDPIANFFKKVLPEKVAYALTRKKNVALSRAIWRFCQRNPDAAKRIIRRSIEKRLPQGYPVQRDFNPPYNPWEQRLCVVPDNDLFQAISKGKASIVTDRIKAFTEDGILLVSGESLSADVIVTATGLNVQLFGGIELSVDGRAVPLSESVVFKGMMLSGVPNFAFAIGYTNSSWTLKVGLVCEHLCRLLKYMDDHGFSTCRPQLPSAEMPTRPFLDFKAGYVLRAESSQPRQGQAAPWTMSMDYYTDVDILRKGPVEDSCLHFSVDPSSSGTSAQSKSEARKKSAGFEKAIAQHQ